MKHLFVVNPVAGRAKPEEKIRMIHEAAGRHGGLDFEIYVTAAPMDAATWTGVLWYQNIAISLSCQACSLM